MGTIWAQAKEILEPLKIMAELSTFVFGSAWAYYKFQEYRELKRLIGFDVEANIFPLACPIPVSSYSWTKNGEKENISSQTHTHVVEISFRFDNKGKTRFKLYNLQASMYTMRTPSEVKFDDSDGHVSLQHLMTSGNIIPIMAAKEKNPNNTSFYYIEPGVSQVIRYVALVTYPRELIQVVGKFSMEQSRIFPGSQRGKLGLYPHTSSRVYPLASSISAPPEAATRSNLERAEYSG